MRIHQLASSLSFGDAITNHTLEIDKALKEWGFETDIFSEKIDKNKILKRKCQIDKKYRKYIQSKEDLLVTI